MPLHAAGAVTPWQAIALEQWIYPAPVASSQPPKKVHVETLNRQAILAAFGLAEEALVQLRSHAKQSAGADIVDEPLDEETFWRGALDDLDSADSDLEG